LARVPVMKLSMPRTFSPRANNSAAMERPMKPAAPVTRYFAKQISLTQDCTVEPALSFRQEYYRTRACETGIGIIGDLFEVVPALIAAVKAAKG
jgi:hypothetical protein